MVLPAELPALQANDMGTHPLVQGTLTPDNLL